MKARDVGRCPEARGQAYRHPAITVAGHAEPDSVARPCNPEEPSLVRVPAERLRSSAIRDPGRVQVATADGVRGSRWIEVDIVVRLPTVVVLNARVEPIPIPDEKRQPPDAVLPGIGII